VVVQQRAAQAEDLGIGIERKLSGPVLITLLRCGNEVLATVLDPAHRFASIKVAMATGASSG